MIRLNLLPDVKIEYLRTKRIQAQVISIATIVTIAVAGLVVLLAVWVYGGQTLQKSYLSGEIKKHGNELKNIPDIDKYLTIQNQLANISTLHGSKNDFSRLLTYLPILNPAAPNNVTLTNVELTSQEETGSVLSLQGEARDYTALATFRDTLANAVLEYDGNKEKLFETVTVASSSLEKSQNNAVVVVFRIDTTYNSNAFLSSVKQPTLTVPVKTTTQSVQSSPDVFGTSSVQKEQR